MTREYHINVEQLILRGWPGELLQQDRTWAIEQARRYYDHEALDSATRHRIKVTWLDQTLHGYIFVGYKYQPATPPGAPGKP